MSSISFVDLQWNPAKLVKQIIMPKQSHYMSLSKILLINKVKETLCLYMIEYRITFSFLILVIEAMKF